MRTRVVGGLTLVGLLCALLVVLSRADLGGADARAVAADFDKKNARYFNLPDGKAQIGVSRVGTRYLTVRWRDADGETWTEPETVYDAGDEMMYNFMRISVAGPTLALFATFVPVPDPSVDFEGYPPGVGSTVYVVCRDGLCVTSRLYDGVPERAPQITSDGERALLGPHGDVYVTWAAHDIEEQRVSGLPEGDYGEGQPLLTPDGSLRAVRGAARSGGCEFTLLTTEPGQAAFRPAATHQDPGDTRHECTSTVESFASDYVVVVGRSKYWPWFAEASRAGWHTVSEDPSGQVRYPRSGHSRIAGRFVISGFWHWRRVLATSPDGRSLVVQVHRPGDEQWGPAQVVARAPEGSECIFIEPMPTYTSGEEDPFYINLRCRSRAEPAGEWVYSYPTAVTDDGRTWHSVLAAEMGLRVGRDVLFRGNPGHRWSPDGGLEQVGLPVPPGAVLSLLSDGTQTLSSLARSASGCDVQVQLAHAGDSAWSAPVPSTATRIPLDLCELSIVQTEGQNIYHFFGHLAADPRMVRLTWPGGDAPQLEDGPFLPSAP